MALDAIVAIPARAKPMRSMDFLLCGTMHEDMKWEIHCAKWTRRYLTTKRSREM
jgi:hypothetical protein